MNIALIPRVYKWRDVGPANYHRRELRIAILIITVIAHFQSLVFALLLPEHCYSTLRRNFNRQTRTKNRSSSNCFYMRDRTYHLYLRGLQKHVLCHADWKGCFWSWRISTSCLSKYLNQSVVQSLLTVPCTWNLHKLP